MAGLSRVLASIVDISDLLDQRVCSESPFLVGPVGPGHGVRYPQQRLFARPEVAIRQACGRCVLPDSLRYQLALPVVLARFSALDDQSLASVGVKVCQESPEGSRAGGGFFLGRGTDAPCAGEHRRSCKKPLRNDCHGKSRGPCLPPSASWRLRRTSPDPGSLRWCRCCERTHARLSSTSLTPASSLVAGAVVSDTAFAVAQGCGEDALQCEYRCSGFRVFISRRATA